MRVRLGSQKVNLESAEAFAAWDSISFPRRAFTF
jgi:hypothetical protein